MALPFPALELFLQQLAELTSPGEGSRGVWWRTWSRACRKAGHQGHSSGPSGGNGGRVAARAGGPPAPGGPTQFSWPACVGLSWQRGGQSLGLPDGAPQACILLRRSLDLVGPEQNRDSISANPQGDRQGPVVVFPRPRPVPTTSPASLDSTCCRVLCVHRGPGVMHSGAACSSRLTVAWAPLLRNFPACSTLASLLHPFIKIYLSHSLSTPSAGC